MKDYDHIVIWLDYFNKTLSRQKGRRLAKDKCIFDPSLSELIESAKAAGLEPTATEDQVRFPRTFLVIVICSPINASLGNLSISYFRLERNGCLPPPVILLVPKFSIDFFTN